MLILLLLYPIDSIASTGDTLTLNVGIVIITLSVLVYKTKKEIRVNESLINLISFKNSILAAIAGGAMTLTATNIISVFGLVIASMAIFLSFLQYLTSKKRAKESERANDIAERKLDLEEKKLNSDMDKEDKLIYHSK